MAQVIVALRIMPVDISADLKGIEKKAGSEIKHFGGEVAKTAIQPFAFGLSSLIVHFIMDEKIGSTESLENSISSIHGVGSVEVTDVRRSIG